MTSKERSRLMSLAQTLDPVVQVGRAGLTPEIVISADELDYSTSTVRHIRFSDFVMMNEL